MAAFVLRHLSYWCFSWSSNPSEYPARMKVRYL
jgi:hypothetical protein